jgi:hypothetical protein
MLEQSKAAKATACTMVEIVTSSHNYAMDQYDLVLDERGGLVTEEDFVPSPADSDRASDNEQGSSYQQQQQQHQGESKRRGCSGGGKGNGNGNGSSGRLGSDGKGGYTALHNNEMPSSGTSGLFSSEAQGRDNDV